VRVDQVQLPPSPSCSVQCLDIDTRCAHGLKADIPILPPGPYLVIQEEFCNAPWRRAGELEPTDPTTGRSVLYTLLEEFTSRNKRHTSKCRLCNKAFTRADRAITHLRHEHLDHRPFRCEGSCGTIWLPMLNPRRWCVLTGQYSLFTGLVPPLKRAFGQ